MKRYAAFFGLHYEPYGGIEDLVGDYDTISEALDGICKEYLKIKEYDTPSEMRISKSIFYQIFDTHTKSKVVHYHHPGFHYQDENGKPCEEPEEHRLWYEKHKK